MFIGEGLTLDASRVAQVERRSANTAKAPAFAAAAAAAASTAAAAATERALSASQPLFALSPPAKMDSIASPPSPPSIDGTSPATSIADSHTGSLEPLVYAEDFYLEHNCSVHALMILCHGLIHKDGTPAIDVLAAPWSMMKKSVICISLKEYQSDITHRWDIMCAYDPDLKAISRDIFHPSQWKLAKLKMCLDNNLVMGDGEHAFLFDGDLCICKGRGRESCRIGVIQLEMGGKRANSVAHSCTR